MAADISSYPQPAFMHSPMQWKYAAKATHKLCSEKRMQPVKGRKNMGEVILLILYLILIMSFILLVRAVLLCLWRKIKKFFGIPVEVYKPLLKKKEKYANQKSDYMLNKNRKCGAEVIIPNGTREIVEGTYAFCKDLERIVIPESVQRIGKRAFYSCEKLKYLILPNSLKEIAEEAFCSCENLEKIVYPDSIIEIGAYAFCYCEALKKVYFPKSLERIGKSAFWHCGNLTEIYLPEKLKELGEHVFQDCKNLKKAVFSNTILSQIDILEWGTFRGCISLTEAYLPNSIRAIKDYAFGDCRSLTQIHLPENLAQIHKNAFTNCKSLENIVLPDTVYQIGCRAFADCQELRIVTLPKQLLCLEKEAFRDCKKITKIYLPDNLMHIGIRAFAGCTDLKEVYLPKRRMQLGAMIFERCDKLNKEEIEEWCHYAGKSEVLPAPAGAKEMSLYGYKFYYQEEITLSHNQKDTFWLDGKKLTFCDLCNKQLLIFQDDIRKYQDKNGNLVIQFYTSIPAFDSADREWNSYEKIYLIWYQKHLCGIIERGGYKLSKVSLYTNITYGDTLTEEFMEVMGMKLEDF